MSSGSFSRTFILLGWSTAALGAILIAAGSARYFVLDPASAAPPPMVQMVNGRRLIFMVHAGFGIIALAAGIWNFSARLRQANPDLHRWLGRAYLIGVLFSGLAGLELSTTAQGGLAGKLGFAMLAALWISTAVFAYLSIRRYDIESHRQWMFRNYSLTFAAVTLRIWLPIFMAAGYDFENAYGAIAWLCWVPNLIVAELIAVNGQGQHPLIARHS